jgi:hypothetical protein
MRRSQVPALEGGFDTVKKINAGGASSQVGSAGQGAAADAQENAAPGADAPATNGKSNGNGMAAEDAPASGTTPSRNKKNKQKKKGGVSSSRVDTDVLD